MSGPSFFSEETVYAAHQDAIDRFGGPNGVLHPNLVAAIGDYAENKFWYGGVRDIPALAAYYGFAGATFHAFVDGNKRVGALLLEGFLELHGYSLTATDSEFIAVMREVADSAIGEPDLVAWVREYSVADIA